MQGGRDPFFGFGDPFGSFNGFGGFGGQRSMLSSFSGGRDPFDDPFFTRPHPGSILGPSFFGSNGGPFMNLPNGGQFMSLPNGGPFMNLPIGSPFMNVPSGGPFMNENSFGFIDHQPSMANISKGPVIEELTSDEKDENESDEKKMNTKKHGRSSKEPIVDDPDDEATEKKSKYMPQNNNMHLLNHGRPRPQTESFTFQSSAVTYGGANGAYYTSSSTRRAGSDGLTFEEFKDANSSTGQATHRVSRGIHEKGHSVTRKLKSDGHVDRMQTLHNLNEDELLGFEQAWLGNAKNHLPGWSEKFALQDVTASGSTQRPQNHGGWLLPSIERSSNARSLKLDNGRRAGSPHQIKTNVDDATGSSRLMSNGTTRH